MVAESTARARARETPSDDEVLRALLGRLMAMLLGDEKSTAAYHAALDRYPALTILCAFETARTLPLPLVKKSRGAYFTFLLSKLCPRVSVPAEPNAPEPAPPESPPLPVQDAAAPVAGAWHPIALPKSTHS